MKIIYYCSTGLGASAVAAALHVGIISPDRFPAAEELGRLSFFSKEQKKKAGPVYYIGRDAWGNMVYSLGIEKEKSLLIKTIKDLMEIYGKNNQYLLVDATDANNYLTKWGRQFPGKLGLLFYVLGIKKNYKKLAGLVKEVQSSLH
ncbi:DUF3189 family protein [Thermincola ferriacetica]